jgi:uncharacterized protein
MSISCWEKVQVYIFEINNDTVVLDINRGRPYLVEQVDKAVLRLRGPIEETVAIQQLDAKFSTGSILSSIQKLAGWRLLIPVHEPMPAKPTEPSYPGIDSIELNIAEDCNLRCSYCCVGQGGFGSDRKNGRKRGLMEWEIARRSIDLLFAESTSVQDLHIRFFGGEPLLNWPLIEKSVDYTEEKAGRAAKKISFSIVINGTLLNEHIIRFMQEHHFWVQISIDGTPEMHDACRVDAEGHGSYQRAVEYVPFLLKTIGPKNVHARGTITHIEPDILKAFDHLQQLGFSTPEVRPVTGHNPKYEMTVQDYLHFNQGANELARRLLESHPSEAGQYISLFQTYITHLMSQSTRRPPCGAGRNMVGISTDGNILPCTDMVGKEHEALQLGDVFNGLKHEKKDLFTNIVDVDNKNGCSNCWARYLCGGACASVELGNEGGLENNAGLECIWIRHVIELSIWLYVKILAERPSLFMDLFGRESMLASNPLFSVLSTG